MLYEASPSSTMLLVRSLSLTACRRFSRKKDHAEEGEDPTDMWLIKAVERCLGGRLKKTWRDVETKRIREHVRDVRHSHEEHVAEHAAVRPQTDRASERGRARSNETPGLPAAEQYLQRQRSSSEPKVELTEPIVAALVVRDEDGILRATLMVPIVLCMLLTDVVLGADCTIAKIESIKGPFWNLSSSVIALFAIRSMYYWVASLADKLAYIQVGVAFVLIYIGVELILMDFVHFGTLLSFGIISGVFALTAIVSVICPKQEKDEPRTPKVSRRHTALACNLQPDTSPTLYPPKRRPEYHSPSQTRL